MKTESLLKDLGLEHGRHYTMRGLEAPVVQPDLYSTLGRRLFDLYQKYKVDAADQREIEGIVFVLQTFILARKKKPIWKKLLRMQ